MERQDKTDRIVAEISEKAQRRRKTVRRIVFVSGNFNIVHPGHLRLLQLAADCGDFLVVGVNADSNPAITLPAAIRLEGVRAIGIVDYAFLLEVAPEEFIRRLKPAVVVKGKEFESRDNPERDAVESYGGKLMFGSGEVRFSSLDLLRREFFETDYSTIRKPTEFPDRHGFDFNDLLRLIDSFSGLRVAVIGDLIVDEYIDCDPLGMSREDPTLVVTPIQQDRFVGGAGVVAAHTVGLGAEVSYFGVVGRDETATFAAEQLAKAGVNARFVVDDSRPTTLKQRFRAQEKTLLRVSHLRQRSITSELAELLCHEVEAILNCTDLVIFSDFNYGCLPQSVVDRIIARCAGRRIRMTADSQSSSQVGDVTRFKGMELVTPTEREARLALRDNSSGLVILAEGLRREAQAEQVFIKLGAEGMLIYGREKGSKKDMTDQLPAFNSAPKDVVGAGDSLLACSSLALAAGGNIWQSAYLGSLAAACQISRLGNSPLSAVQLVTELRL
jgi:rfaE bifunctional protein kinase chain/domain